MRKYTLFFAVCSTLWWTSCKENASSPAIAKPQTADSTVFQLGVQPTVDCLPFFVADKLGYYDSLGLNLKLCLYQAAMDCDTALLRGRIAATVTDLVRAAKMRKDGAKACVVMALDGEHVLVANKSLRAKKLSQLKERTIAGERYAAPDLLTDHLLQRAAMSEEDVFRPQINNIYLRYQMLKENQVDAAILPQPWASLINIETGTRKLFSTKEDSIRLSALATTEKVMADSLRNKQLHLLVTGYNLAVDQLNKSGKAAVHYLTAPPYNIPDVFAQKIQLPKYNTAAAPAASDLKRVESYLRYSVSDLISAKYVKHP